MGKSEDLLPKKQKLFWEKQPSMKGIYKYILIISCTPAYGYCVSIADTVNLNEVSVISPKSITFSNGSNVKKIDPFKIKVSQTEKIADLLSSNSSIYIKQYGALATATIRGTSSSHTAVNWNGIPINSIANGLSDLSNIAALTNDNIFLIKGGNSTIFGSGSIGGSINIDSKKIRNQKLSSNVNFESGSNGLSSQSYSAKYGDDIVSFYILHSKLKDKNKFKFTNISLAGSPRQTNNHGKIVSFQNKLDLNFKLNPKIIIQLNYWGDNSTREVPQNMTIRFTDAMQYDVNDRISISSTYSVKNLSYKISKALIYEDFRYTEEIKNINSQYLASKEFNNFDLSYTFKNLIFQSALSYNKNKINNNNFENNKQKDISKTIFFSTTYKKNNLETQLAIRGEDNSEYEVPLTPLFSTEYKFNELVQSSIKLNKNFRSPTFNDRYWFGGGSRGNIKLKPEISNNSEFSIHLKKNKFKLLSTLFNLNVKDWILWSQNIDGIWSPENIKEVWSRGIETQLKYNYKKISLELNYSLTKTTSEKASNILDISVGQQLRYVPKNKLNTTLLYVEGNLISFLNITFTDEVITSYSSVDNKTLESYTLVNAGTSYKLFNEDLKLDLRVLNLTNQQYQTYLNYPNPGREYVLSINYTIN
ncbi:TonB-dependent receptor [Bacteroidota bacterium]|nr:TonB-dependent receptor [Bacteroidota bacterium]